MVVMMGEGVRATHGPLCCSSAFRRCFRDEAVIGCSELPRLSLAVRLLTFFFFFFVGFADCAVLCCCGENGEAFLITAQCSDLPLLPRSSQPKLALSLTNNQQHGNASTNKQCPFQFRIDL